MADLDELERLEKAANILQYGKLSFGRAGNADLVAFNGEDVTGIASFGNVHRAAYVAALCNALPELLARLRAAEARIAELEAALRHERTALSLVLERQRQGDRCTVSVRDLQQGISLLDAALTRKP